MKAVIYEQYGEPDVLKTANLDKPTLKAGEVLVKVGASGINPVDTYFRKGIRPVEQFPYIPHFDVAGEIVEVGEAVADWKVGDRIWATNAKHASAEFVAIPSEIVFPLPNDVSYEEGAALAMAFVTAHLSLFKRGQLQKGESVLIYGAAGAVGHAAVQLAKSAGAFVIATAGNKEKGDIAKKAGADEVIFYKDENVVDRVMEITAKKGVPLILDMSLSENMEQDFEMLAFSGRIVAIGSPVNNTPPLLWRQLNIKHAALLGVLLFSAPSALLQEAGFAISKGLQEGLYSAHLGKVFSFEQAKDAHAALEAKTYNGSIVLIP
ncbi:NADPH:quinone reductase [Halalkalibacterium ligniniphilum]|uniref:NADPH:quinone reductase n=2 Tax=Halalkalibacterium ligniniphilum TaxID=1134413 RepID=UPI00034DA6BE|nr:NADPH:quinone reductase [Halalkalibacterium ligniniphilum]